MSNVLLTIIKDKFIILSYLFITFLEVLFAYYYTPTNINISAISFSNINDFTKNIEKIINYFIHISILLYVLSLINWSFFAIVKRYIYFKSINLLSKFKENFKAVIKSILYYYFFWNTVVFVSFIIYLKVFLLLIKVPNLINLIFLLLLSIMLIIIYIFIFYLRLTGSILVGIEEISPLELRKIVSYSSIKVVMLNILYLLIATMCNTKIIPQIWQQYLVLLFLNILTGYVLVKEYISFRAHRCHHCSDTAIVITNKNSRENGYKGKGEGFSN